MTKRLKKSKVKKQKPRVEIDPMQRALHIATKKYLDAVELRIWNEKIG